MSRFHSYINSAKEILIAYKGNEPFATFIKKHFSAHKKFGSKDRKQISHICYCFFRIGKLFETVTMEERLLIALFLCSNEENAILMNLKPEWNEKASLSVEEKLIVLNYPFDPGLIFPFTDELSNGIDKNAFAWSHLTQPDLFLRIRPGRQEKVISKLEADGLSFQMINDTCVALTNTSKIDDIIKLNKEAVVQDYSSQRVGELLNMVNYQSSKKQFSVWDCCAASGGKSIMAYDLMPGSELTVSDIRNSILSNLQARFEEAEIKKYNSFVADLSDSSFVSHHSLYDLIITDVPCSGSGTWGRTPEQLHFFKAAKIEEYATLQKKIVTNITPYIKKGGFLLYSTCSVFEKENEGVVHFIKENPEMELIEMKLLKGYEVKADTMFAALFKKS